MTKLTPVAAAKKKLELLKKRIAKYNKVLELLTATFDRLRKKRKLWPEACKLMKMTEESTLQDWIAKK